MAQSMRRTAKNTSQKSFVSGEEIIIQDWAHLCDLVFCYRKNGYWIFRGEGSEDWKLRPKIGRPESRKRISDGKPLPYSPRSEETILGFINGIVSRRLLNLDPERQRNLMAVAELV
jgi:hypothetical protein